MAHRKQKEALDRIVEEEQKREHIFIGGLKIKKHHHQCIPYTEEEMEKQKVYKNRQLINFIDKVFFEDGALQLEKRGIRK